MSPDDYSSLEQHLWERRAEEVSELLGKKVSIEETVAIYAKFIEKYPALYEFINKFIKEVEKNDEK